MADYGYRPSSQESHKSYEDRFDLTMKLYTIKDFGGWEKAYETYFDDGAIFDEIYNY